VNFSFTTEQDAFRAEARRFLSERVDVRAQIALLGAHDSALWKEMASQGWLGFGIPETQGGQGASLVDVCILLEETGRALLPGPLLPHTIASMALVRTNTEDDDLLRALASGETVAACGGDLEIPVAGGIVADEVVVMSFMEPAVAHRGTFDARAVETADLTRPAARITLRGDLEPLPRPVPLLPVASVALAAESVGAAAAALDMAVSYAKDRHQFGRPIGSFQAIKHKAADMLRALEAARLTVYYAASAIDAEEADAHVAAAMAKVAANEALMRCAAENIQIHGGIGVTWEHDAHLYYRRALASSAMFGESPGGRDLVARALFAELPQ
jgi:alkylation response protein AidB-like acyl-CoA dehydrogenase